MKKLLLIFILLLAGINLRAQNTTDEKKSLEFDEYFFDAMNERLKANYEKSNEYFEQCLALDDQNDAIYFKIAQNYTDTKNYPEALQYLEQAKKLNPDNKWYQKLYIDIKIAEDTPREEVMKLIKEFEATAQNKYLINALYRKLNRKTFKVNYKQPEKKNITSKTDELQSLWQEKKYKELVQTGEKKLEEQPDNPQVYLYVARGYLALKKPKKALEFLEMGNDFILNDPKMQRAYYRQFIKAYEQLKKPKKVKQYQQKLQKI